MCGARYPASFSHTHYRSHSNVGHGVVLDPSGATYLCLVSDEVSDVNPAHRNIYGSVNKSLKGQWASLACHETGSLVVQVCQSLATPDDVYLPFLEARFREFGRVR